MKRARTIPITEPVHRGIQPMNVKRIIHRRAPMLTVYWLLFPLVAIRMARIIVIVIVRLRNVPAWMFVMSSAVPAEVSQSDQITISK